MKQSGVSTTFLVVTAIDGPGVSSGAPDDLVNRAEDFADDVTRTIAADVPFEDRFSAAVLDEATADRIVVVIRDPGTLEELSFPLYVCGKVRLRMFMKFECQWDSEHTFLAVEKSWIFVRLGDREKDDGHKLIPCRIWASVQLGIVVLLWSAGAWGADHRRRRPRLGHRIQLRPPVEIGATP